MSERQLVVAVETTGALGPYWTSLISEYLEKIIRSFHANDLPGPRSMAPAEFAMVLFNSHCNNNCFMYQRTGWTRNPDNFLSWLASPHFSGGGFSDACIAEGLSETLIMLYDEDKGPVSLAEPVTRHCVVVCASKPYALPTPVFRPRVLGTEEDDAVHPALGDAEMLAKCFPHCGISLSIVSPKQLPQLRTVFNAAKKNPRADSSSDQVKHGQHLVLISDSFLEARSALNQPLNSANNNNTVPVNNNGNTVANPIVLKQDGPSTSVGQSSNSSVTNPSLMNRPMANMPPAPTNVKLEPVTGPGFPHPPTQPITSPQIPQDTNPSIMQNTPSNPSNPISTPLDQDLKPSQNPNPAQPIRPVGPTAPANVSILNNLSQLRQGGATSIGLPTIGGPTPIAVHMSNLMSGTGSGTGAGTGMVGSFNSTAASLGNNPNSNLQGMGQMGQGGSSSMMMGNQSGITGLPGPGLGSGPGSMMSQQQGGGMSQMSMQQHPNAQQSQSKYVKIWEGTLSGQRQGQPVFICKLEGYRSASASDTLAADWPATMQIVRLIAQEHMNNKQYVGKADFLVFRTLNQHGFLGQLQEKKLCAVIQLPSQTLLLSVSDKAGRLIGMLFPGDMVVFKPQVSSSSQQPQMQMQPQPQQTQMQQQQMQQNPMQQQQMQQNQMQQNQMQQNQMMGGGSMGMGQSSSSTFMRPQGMPPQSNKPQNSMTGPGGFM